MIQGYFSTVGLTRRPFVNAFLQFANISITPVELPLLVDTGADRTILSPVDALKLEIDFGLRFSKLKQGIPSTGVGGKATTRTADVKITIDTFSADHLLTVLEPPQSGPIPSIPSLLGRDILKAFGLFMHERTNRVLLLEHPEADSLPLPPGSKPWQK